MIEEPNPYNPKYRIQSHGYEAYAKDLRAWGDSLKARVEELEAKVSSANESVADIYDRFKEVRQDRDQWKARAESLLTRA